MSEVRIGTSGWHGQGVDVFGYVNNDADGNAVRNGLTLSGLVAAGSRP